MNITQVEAFLTEDGKYFPTKEEAIAYQHGADLEEEIHQFIGDGYNAWLERSAIRRWEIGRAHV